MSLLIAFGADYDARDKAGATPLLYGARYNHAECVRVLLEAGADPSAPK